MPGPKAVPRPSGGMRQTFGRMDGGLNEAHSDSNAMKAAMGNKSATQNQAMKAIGQKKPNQGGKGTNLGQALQGQPGSKQAVEPRPIGSFKQELVDRPFKDIVGEIKQFFSIKRLLDIDPSGDTPEEKAKKKQMHARWQKLTQAEQQVAKQKYQEKLKKKQEEEREKQMKEQREKEQKAKAIAPPSTPKRGPGSPGGNKSATAQLQQSRQTIGSLNSAN